MENTEEKVFRAKKQIGAAITWIVCALLLIPCYQLTNIIAMLIIVPIMLVIAAGFMREGFATRVKIANGEMEIVNAAYFRLSEEKIPISDIKAAKIDKSVENKTEIIHIIEISHSRGKTLIPDIDDKAGLLNIIKQERHGIKIETM